LDKKDGSRNLDIFKAGGDVLVEVDGRDLSTQLADAVLVFDVPVVATELVSVHFVPVILPPELLPYETDADND